MSNNKVKTVGTALASKLGYFGGMNSSFLKTQKIRTPLLAINGNNLSPIFEQRNNIGSSNCEHGTLTREAKTRDEPKRAQRRPEGTNADPPRELGENIIA